MTMKSTPVGPVAGGIMGCFLLLALGVYCYRHHIHRHSHQYVSTLPDNPHRNSHYYEDEQEPTDDTIAGKGGWVADGSPPFQATVRRKKKREKKKAKVV